MANARIRGMTLEINGDTTGLQKSLKNVNSEIRSTEKQLKDVERLLKLDPTNTELLAQKQKLLSDRVEETENKLKTLKDTQAEFIKDGGDIDSSGYRALEREIISTESALRDAQRASSEFNINLEKASAALKNVSNNADQVANATKGLSTVGARVASTLLDIGYSTVKASDELNTLAKQTGLSTAEIQKFQYASELVDVSVSDITGALRRLTSNMDSQEDTWNRLGISTRDASGEMRDANEVFYETLDALSRIENETERDQVAMTLFGRNANQLAGIIDDGGKALREMGDEAENLGLILSQDTLDSINSVNDTVDRLRAQFRATFAENGAKLVEELTPLINRVANALSNVVNYIGRLSGRQLETILKIAGAVALISPVAGIISRITGTASKLMPVLSKINTLIAANPTIAIIGAIVIAVGALTALIIRNWDTIKATLSNVASWIRERVISPVTNFFENLWGGLKSGVKTVGNFFINVANGVIRGINKLIAGLNKISFSIPSWVPVIGGKSWGFNIKSIGEIPMLANGGKVLNGGMAIVGEAGAEMLSVQNGQAVVRPLTSSNTRSAGITINMNNTFNGYNSSQGAQLSRDLTRQINIALGRA